jgi:hypothetical protein
MLKVRPIYCELVICIQLGFESICCVPRIQTKSFKYVHSVMDCRTVPVAIHVNFGRWCVSVGISGKDDIPVAVNIVKLRSPEIGRVVHTLWRLENELPFGIVPVAMAQLDGWRCMMGKCLSVRQDWTAQKGDVVVSRVGSIVVPVVLDDPSTTKVSNMAVWLG